jgi:hypothetical protein
MDSPAVARQCGRGLPAPQGSVTQLSLEFFTSVTLIGNPETPDRFRQIAIAGASCEDNDRQRRTVI